MGKNFSINLDRCVYCGKFFDDKIIATIEHFPSKMFFSKSFSREVKFKYLPCCEKCNSGKAKDDEYIKDILSGRIGADCPGSSSLAEKLKNNKTCYHKDGNPRDWAINISDIVKIFDISTKYVYLRSSGEIDIKDIQKKLDIVFVHLSMAAYSIKYDKFFDYDKNYCDIIPLEVSGEEVPNDVFRIIKDMKNIEMEKFTDYFQYSHKEVEGMHLFYFVIYKKPVCLVMIGEKGMSMKVDKSRIII